MKIQCFFTLFFSVFFFLKKYVFSKQFFYDDTNYFVFTYCQLCYSCEIENKFKNSVYFSSHTLTSMTFDPITATHSPICADFYAIIVNRMTACFSCISTNTSTHSSFGMEYIRRIHIQCFEAKTTEKHTTTTNS